MWAIGSFPDPDGAPPVVLIHRRTRSGPKPSNLIGPEPVRSRRYGAPRESIQMIALPRGSPALSTATVPDHCDVTDTAMISVLGEEAIVLRVAAVIALHQA